MQHVRSLVSGQWAMMDPRCRSSCLKMTNNYEEAETGMVRIDRLSPVAIAGIGEESKLGIALTVSSKVFAKSCPSKRGAEGAGGKVGSAFQLSRRMLWWCSRRWSRQWWRKKIVGRAVNGFDIPLMSLFSESFYPAVLMALAAMGGKSDQGR